MLSALPRRLYGDLRHICGPTTWDSLVHFRCLPAESTPEVDAQNRVCIFIEPHFDDVAFSCGGFLAKLARRRKSQGGAPDLHLITVFARGPDAGTPLSSLAQNVHLDWGLSPPSFRRRRQEARSATAPLPLSEHELDFQDVLYRESYDLDALKDVRQPDATGTEVPCFPELSRALRDAVDNLRGAREGEPTTRKVLIVAPFGVGGHLDHRVVHAAVRRYACREAPPTQTAPRRRNHRFRSGTTRISHTSNLPR